MRHQVFISYSRKDTKIVDKICKTFNENGITYFIDRTGISGGLEFPELIVNAIDQCDVFLFIGSRNSYSSRFVSNEVTYAYNNKTHNSIIPYLIDDTPLPKSLQFIFGNVNYRKMKEHPINTVLIQDIKNLLSVETTRPSSEAKPQEYETTKLTFKDKHPLFYAGTATQIALLLTIFYFFCHLLKPGWGYIGKHIGNIYWWTNVILCISLILSTASTLLLPLKRKKIFYGICGLDIVQGISTCIICSKIGSINFDYQTKTYQSLDKIGDLINHHPFLIFVFIAAIISIHCYTMYRILRLKHNGTSIWETMR